MEKSEVYKFCWCLKYSWWTWFGFLNIYINYNSFYIEVIYIIYCLSNKKTTHSTGNDRVCYDSCYFTITKTKSFIYSFWFSKGMLIQKNTVSQLRDFGLNSYESKLWAALLSRGVATAGELSDIANVPRSRSYDVLESLEKKGFLIMKIGKPIKYLAVDPDHVLIRVRKRITEDADIQTQIISNLENSEILNELKTLHKTGIKNINPSELSGIFKGRKNVYHYVERAIKSAKKQVIIQTTETGLIKEKEYIKLAIKKAKENGVKIQIAAPLTQENEQAAKELSKFADIRNTETSGRFYMIDGEEIIFMLMNDTDVHQTYDSAIWVKSPFFVSSMKKMFSASWANMKKLQ